MSKNNNLKKIISHAKEYGFVYPSSEIYDGLNAVYDYGPNGVELKNNIKNYWWKEMVLMHENIVGLDSAIFMHPKVWKASGHVEAFNDPMIDNKNSKKRYRADVLIEDHLQKLQNKIVKEITKAKKRFKESFNEEKFLIENTRISGICEKIENIKTRFSNAMTDENLSELKQIILDENIKDPASGSNNWTDVRKFNLMFSTSMGAIADEANTIYLRPETAQGIFINFLNVQKTSRMKLPFGIAQIGKAFRNEIIARQFIFRMREFEQMEMQYFVKPGDEMKWFDYWKNKRMNWHRSLGFDTQNYRFHDHDNLAHYANAATDIEFNFPMGYKEVEGIHSRTDFDLVQHQKFSGKKLQYFDSEENKSYIPYVIETSIGLDRMFLQILTGSYTEEHIAKDNAERVVMKIPPALAPVKVAILPLIRKDNLPKIAQNIFNELKLKLHVQYEEKDSIGKRYRRQDAIGTPYCVTIDHNTLENNTVTVRDRDTMKQKRLNFNLLKEHLTEKLDMQNQLKNE